MSSRGLPYRYRGSSSVFVHSRGILLAAFFLFVSLSLFWMDSDMLFRSFIFLSRSAGSEPRVDPDCANPGTEVREPMRSDDTLKNWEPALSLSAFLSLFVLSWAIAMVYNLPAIQKAGLVTFRSAMINIAAIRAVSCIREQALALCFPIPSLSRKNKRRYDCWLKTNGCFETALFTLHVV